MIFATKTQAVIAVESPTRAGKQPFALSPFLSLRLVLSNHGVFACAVLLYAVWLEQIWSFTLDDAYISLRYAWNAVHGAGLVYSPGQRVQGFTNPSLVLLEAVLLFLHVPAVLSVVKLLSAFSGVGLLWLLRGNREWPHVGAVTLFASVCAPVIVRTVGGLETVPFTFFVVLGISCCVKGDDRGLIALSCAALTRPEGFLFASVFSIIAVRRAPRLVLAAWIPVIVYEGWAWSFYGSVVPSTFLAKEPTHTFARSFYEWLPSFGSFLVLDANILVVVGALCAVVRRPKVLWPVGVCIGLYTLYLAYEGRAVSMGEWYRYYVPLLGLLLWMCTIGLRDIRWDTVAIQRRRFFWLGVGVVIALNAATLSVARTSGLALDPVFTRWPLESVGPALTRAHIALGYWLRDNRPSSHSSVALWDAGAISYVSQMPALDMYSLNDLTIIRDARDGRTDTIQRYILSHRPTYIIGIGNWIPWNLQSNTSFQRAYRRVMTPPFVYIDDWDRLVVYERVVCLSVGRHERTIC